MLKTPPESDQWFQSSEQLKDFQNNRKQKKCIPVSGCINAPNFRLIPLDRNTYTGEFPCGIFKTLFQEQILFQYPNTVLSLLGITGPLANRMKMDHINSH